METTSASSSGSVRGSTWLLVEGKRGATGNGNGGEKERERGRKKGEGREKKTSSHRGVEQSD